MSQGIGRETGRCFLTAKYSGLFAKYLLLTGWTERGGGEKRAQVGFEPETFCIVDMCVRTTLLTSPARINVQMFLSFSLRIQSSCYAFYSASDFSIMK